MIELYLFILIFSTVNSSEIFLYNDDDDDNYKITRVFLLSLDPKYQWKYKE